MICIEISGTTPDFIYWEMSEDFTELVQLGEIELVHTSAVEIEVMDISLRSKLLLSAAAGAAIQHLIDLEKDWMDRSISFGYSN